MHEYLTIGAGAAGTFPRLKHLYPTHLVMHNLFHLAIRLPNFLLFISIGWLVSCQVGNTIHITSYKQGVAMGQEYVRHYKPHRKQANWQGPPTSFTRLRRTNPAGNPVIAGYVDIQEENGKFTPLPGPIITIDDAHIFADQAGNYVQVIGSGSHHVRVGGVGLLWSEAPSLHVQRGDSIRINVHLLPEFRPVIN
ncbi:hypothetical protein [Hymenobacter sp. UYCo722]|uniref:hypothetical protein n=1 Tax=Hymenobacter sp. UYCo722 TaxID=3156335 RepID=UPI003398EC21